MTVKSMQWIRRWFGALSLSAFGPALADALPELDEVVVHPPPTPVFGWLDEAYSATGAASRMLLERDTLDALGADRLEALDMAWPGAGSAMLNGGLSTVAMSRGFAIARPYWNGLPDIQRLFVRDLGTVDQVVVLRGPDAVLHGLTSPGGVVHYVGKRPQEVPQHSLSLRLGQHEQWRWEVDSTGPLGPVSEASGLSWRVVGARQGGHQEPGRLGLERSQEMGVLHWRYRPGGSLTLESEHQENHRPFSFGTVHVGGRVRYDQVYASPDQHSRRRYQRRGVAWEERLSPALTLAAHHAHSQVARDETLFGFWSVRDEQSLWGYYTAYRDRYSQRNWRAEARLRFDTGSLAHQWVLGHDRNRHHIRFGGVQNIAGFTIDVAQPDFSAIEPDALELAPRYNHERHRERAWFVADRVRLGPVWSASLGWRRQHFDTLADRSGRGLLVASRGQADGWHAGLEAELGTLHLHLTRTASMEPNRGMTREGGFLPAQRARQLELGARWKLARGMRLEGAVYRIDLRHLPMTDPEDRTALVSSGHRRVTGLDGAAHLAWRAWTATLQGNWLDTQNRATTAPGQGAHFVGVPRFSGSLRVSLAHAGPAASRWESWLGLVRVGPRYGDAANSFQVPGYMRVDLGSQTQLADGTLRLGIRNLTDSRHVAAISSASDVHQGARRGVWVSYSMGL